MSQVESGLARRALASGLVEAADLARCRAALRDDADDARVLEWLLKQGLLTKWQAAQLEAGRTQNLVMHGYKLLAPLGAGGMGSVYRALDTKSGCQVALKVLPPRQATAEAIGRFRREAFVALQMRHDHVVASFELAQQGTIHFLVMELVDGRSLSAHLVKHGRLGVRETARIGRDVALALEHAHQQGIIHRDIKPSNILLSREGHVKVADMGLAKFFGPQSRDSGPETSTGQFLGTIDYCSPEQAIDAKRADIRSDIYSLGCTLYRCLTGLPPFAEGTEVQRIMAHIELLPSSIRIKNRDVPPAFAELIEKRMLAKDPGDRFQTPIKAAEALDPWIKGEGSSANLWAGLESLDGLIEAAAQAPRVDVPRAAAQSQRDTARWPKSPVTRRAVKLRMGAKDESILRGPLAWAALVLVILAGATVASLWWPRRKVEEGIAGGEPILEGRLIPNPPSDPPSPPKGHDEQADALSPDETTSSAPPDGAPSEGPAESPDDRSGSGGSDGEASIASLPPSARGDDLPQPKENGAKDAPPPQWDDNRDAGEDTPFAGGTGGVARRIARPRELLRGIECSFGKYDNASHLADLAPVFGDQRPELLPQGEVAREGYAVGGMHVDAQRWVNAVRLIYMRIKPDGKLNPRDSYLGQWIGFRGREKPATLTGDGTPIIGLHVRKGIVLDAIALVVGQKASVVQRHSWGRVHIYHAAFSPDGRYYLGGGDGGALRVWDMATGEQKLEIAMPVGVFTADSKHVVAHNYRNAIHIFSVTDGKPKLSWQTSSPVSSLAVAPDGKHLISSHADNVLRLWDIANATGRAIREFRGHSRPPEMVFSSDSKRLLSAGEDRSVRLWNVESGKLIHAFPKFAEVMPIKRTNLIVRAWFLSDREIAAYVWGQQKRLLVWDAATGEVLRKMDLGADFSKDAAISPDGRYVVTAHGDNTVRLHNLKDATQIGRLRMPVLPRAVSFSPDGQYVIAGGYRGWLYVWRLEESLLDVAVAHRGPR